jgi:hypothetical protein
VITQFNQIKKLKIHFCMPKLDNKGRSFWNVEDRILYGTSELTDFRALGIKIKVNEKADIEQAKNYVHGVPRGGTASWTVMDILRTDSIFNPT